MPAHHTINLDETYDSTKHSIERESESVEGTRLNSYFDVPPYYDDRGGSDSIPTSFVTPDEPPSELHKETHGHHYSYGAESATYYLDSHVVISAFLTTETGTDAR